MAGKHFVGGHLFRYSAQMGCCHVRRRSVTMAVFAEAAADSTTTWGHQGKPVSQSAPAV
jgi:hypothetical protein